MDRRSNSSRGFVSSAREGEASSARPGLEKPSLGFRPPEAQAHTRSQLQAAIAAAAAAAGRDVTTAIFDDPRGQAAAAPPATPSPAADAAGDSRAQRRDARDRSSTATAPNPLVQLLVGYGGDEADGDDDDDEGDGDDDRAGAAGDPSGAATGAAAAASPRLDSAAPAVAAEQHAARQAAESVDPELASFFGALESEGLLDDDPAPLPSSSAAWAVESQRGGDASAAAPSDACGHASGVASDGVADAAAWQAAGGGESEAAGGGGGALNDGVASADARATMASGQTLLEHVAWAPEWARVRDEASGSVYFWNCATNAVEWDAPPRPEDWPPPGALEDVPSDLGLEEREGGGAGTAADNAAPSADGVLVAGAREGGDAAAAADGGGAAPPHDPAPVDAADAAAATRGGCGESGGVRDGAGAAAASGAAALEDGEVSDAGAVASDAAQGVGAGSAVVAHARASAALAAALGAAASSPALATLLQTAPSLLMLHAQLQVRKNDLAALRGALRGAGVGAREAAARACAHIHEHVAAVAAALPDAVKQAEAILAGCPEDGELATPGGGSSAAPSADAAAEGAQPAFAVDPPLPLDFGGLGDAPEAPPPLPAEDPPAAGRPGDDEAGWGAAPRPASPASGALVVGASAWAPQGGGASAVGTAEDVAGASVADAWAAAVEGAKKRKKAREVPGGVRKKGKKADALISKWQAVAKEEEEQEQIAERTREDPEAAKAAEIEAWVAQQIRSGEAQNNPNFVPLGSDWRVRVAAVAAAKRKRAASHSPPPEGGPAHAQAAEPAEPSPSTSQAAAPLHFDSAPDLAALSLGLPPGWQAMWDAASGDVYYGNTATQV